MRVATMKRYEDFSQQQHERYSRWAAAGVGLMGNSGPQIPDNASKEDRSDYYDWVEVRDQQNLGFDPERSTEIGQARLTFSGVLAKRVRLPRLDLGAIRRERRLAQA